MLETIQGVRPKHAFIVLGNENEEKLIVDKFFSYYKNLKNSFLNFHASPSQVMPDPTISNDHGRWSELAKKQLIELDHLSLVANISHSQIKNLDGTILTPRIQIPYIALKSNACDGRCVAFEGEDGVGVGRVVDFE